MRIEQVVGDHGEKQRWRAARARLAGLPAAYRDSADAVQQYLLHLGAIDDDRWTSAVEDLADLFEQAAADRTPIRDLVGEDPIDFAETFSRSYSSGDRRSRAQRKLLDAIERADAVGVHER